MPGKLTTKVIEVETIFRKEKMTASFFPDIPGLAIVHVNTGWRGSLVYNVVHVKSGRVLFSRPCEAFGGCLTVALWLTKEATKAGFSWDTPVEELLNNLSAREIVNRARERFPFLGLQEEWQ